jgi:uncharacterized BrkB/YihY/UPF0761 family membrane protein
MKTKTTALIKQTYNGIGILLFGASGAFTELQEALNTIWGVKPKEEGLKGLVKDRFISFTMVLGTCFLLLVSLIISSIVAAMSESLSAHLPGGATLGQLLENAVSFLVITALFSMIFKVLPEFEMNAIKHTVVVALREVRCVKGTPCDLFERSSGRIQCRGGIAGSPDVRKP